MSPHEWNVYDIYLSPGGFYFGCGHDRVKTLLGSCVAVTVYHPAHQCGGMGHFMLPSRGMPVSSPPPTGWDGKYADEMMHLFMDRIRSAGTRPHDYVVKLFGGGNMFPGLKKTTVSEDGVSTRNVQAARALMATYGFTVAAEHLGGDGHRNLVFDLADGTVYLSFKKTASNSGLKR